MNDRLWNEKTKKCCPYVPGEQPKGIANCIKLNTNENPYPPSPMVKEALEQFSYEVLRLYPDPGASSLKETIAGYYELLPEQIFTGNGSDEILAMAFQAFFDDKKPVAFADITYSFYPVYADFYSVPSEIFPLDEKFTIRLEDYKTYPGGVILANPNAPTGIGIPLEQIRELLQCNESRLVVVDEAYIDFGGESAVGLISEFDNLLVIQTVSKSRSLAGLRVGYAMGNPSLIKALENVRDSFNSYTLDTLAQTVANASLKDGAWFEQTRSMIMQTRDLFVEDLKKLGFVTLPSSANFIFTTHPEFSARRLYEVLRERGILVRYFDKPRIREYLRISIGTREEMTELIHELENIMLEGA